LRRVIFHYHLFKNAGTSVDHILKNSFPDGWAEREFRFTKNQWPYEDIASWVDENPDIVAFSSHTARLPVPVVSNVEVFPVIFFRHPMLRLHSGYNYERTQDAETPGAKMAKDLSFQDYLAWRLTRPRDASARNFQSNRLSHMFRPERGMLTEVKDLEALTLRALDNLPFLGFVEKFDDSMKTLAKSLARKGLDLKLSSVQENVNSDLSISPEARIQVIRNEIDEETFEKFEAMNEVDLKVYDIVKSWYG